ncbi:MAG: pyridoxal phosphate-dependent aminotransferase [Marinomonas sp.]
MVWLMDKDFTLKTPLTNDHISENPEQFSNISMLHLNEAFEAPADLVKAGVAHSFDSLNRYPDIKRAALSRAVADNTGVEPKCQAWGSGASDLLYRAFCAVKNAGKNAIAPTPTFWGYERIYGLTQVDIRRVEIRSDLQMHAADILAAVDENTALVSVVTPGSPTGISMTEGDLLALAKGIPDDVLFLIDEVYFEFAKESLNAIELLRKHRTGHWAVIRSFSKAYALASARIGYALCSSEDVANRLIESGLNFPVSSLSFSAAHAVYTDPKFLTNMVTCITQRRAWMHQQLEVMGLNPIPSDTNFISVKLPIPAPQALAILKESKVLCSQWNHPSFPNYIRITIGSEEANQQFVNALSALLESL